MITGQGCLCKRSSQNSWLEGNNAGKSHIWSIKALSFGDIRFSSQIATWVPKTDSTLLHSVSKFGVLIESLVCNFPAQNCTFCLVFSGMRTTETRDSYLVIFFEHLKCTQIKSKLGEQLHQTFPERKSKSSWIEQSFPSLLATTQKPLH